VNFSLDQFPPFLRPVLRFFDIDFAPKRPPAARSIVLATVVALVGSLVADWLLVKVGIALYPAQKNYQHFQFHDYAKLTIVGVLIACAGWPVVARLSSRAEKLYLWLAVAVTLVLLLPDVAIWYLGQPADAVFVLVWLHLAIAVVTYLAVVLIAPTRPAHAR
jgi:hypothetical protein